MAESSFSLFRGYLFGRNTKYSGLLPLNYYLTT